MNTSTPEPPQQQIPMHDAMNITASVITMMYNYFENAKEPNGNKLANNEVLLSLKHTQLLLRPYVHLALMKEKRNYPLPPRK